MRSCIMIEIWDMYMGEASAIIGIREWKKPTKIAALIPNPWDQRKESFAFRLFCCWRPERTCSAPIELFKEGNRLLGSMGGEGGPLDDWFRPCRI